MSHDFCHGCDEFNRLSRRGFLVAGGAALAATAFTPRVAFARSHRSDQRDVLVSIFLRGGADALTLCVPHAEPSYYTARPTLSVPRPDSGQANRATDLDGFFGLPPALAPLLPAYNDGHMLVVHACGSTDPTRSHFVGQFNLESARGTQAGVSSGWLGRHLATIPPAVPNALIRGVGLSYAGIQQTLVGGPRSLALPPAIASFGLNGSLADQAQIDAVREMYTQYGEPMRTTAIDSLDTVGVIRGVNFNGYQPSTGVAYPETALGKSLKQVAALIKAQVGVECVAIDSGNGWDTHAQQGSLSGNMATLMSGLATALAAFHHDMTTGNAPSTTVVVMSEFGRSLRENSSLGTDHGHAGAMLVLGPAVDGGRVLCDWPGLAPEQLYEGRDLKVTTDYRDILAEIVSERLGNPNLSSVFPGHTPHFRGIFGG